MAHLLRRFSSSLLLYLSRVLLNMKLLEGTVSLRIKSQVCLYLDFLTSFKFLLLNSSVTQPRKRVLGILPETQITPRALSLLELLSPANERLNSLARNKNYYVFMYSFPL